MEVKLSVLIATMPSRIDHFNQLMLSLGKQPAWSQALTQICVDDSMDYNIGTKRNKLLNRACGDYIIFADDDDLVSEDYLPKIIEATSYHVDCIGISGIITTDGRDQRQWHISKEYGSWFTGEDGTYYRTPNHISPVRRELALQAEFPEIAFGEDYQYSMRLLPLLKTEVIVPGNLYFYKYISNKK